MNNGLAYLKTCGGCGSEIFMAVCRDGRWRPFETELQLTPLPFAWAWRKQHGMEETDTVRGHLIHYCADYHDAVDFGAVLSIRETKRCIVHDQTYTTVCSGCRADEIASESA